MRHRPQSILLVDDERAFASCCRGCSKSAYDVEIAADGEAAIPVCCANDAHYDLLISDLNMPGMDGLTLIREAHAHRFDAAGDRHHRLLHGESSAIEALNLGVAGYLTKPFGAARCCAAAQRPRAHRPGVIQLSDLTKSFGDRVLFDHVTWQIGDGDRVGLCGPNGAGKTTLLKILAGLEEPDSGAVVKPAGLYRSATCRRTA